MLLIGKQIISIRAIYTMAMLNNLRVHLSYTQWTNGHQMDQPSIHRKTTKNLLILRVKLLQFYGCLLNRQSIGVVYGIAVLTLTLTNPSIVHHESVSIIPILHIPYNKIFNLYIYVCAY